MARFNSVTQPKTVSSYEGATLYEKDTLEEFLNFLFSSYLTDQFYETKEEQLDRFLRLTHKVEREYGPEFIAKAAYFARNELGMRSISTLLAADLNSSNGFQKETTKRKFFAEFPHRPDDVAELFAAIDMLKNKRSHATVRGCGDYISSLNGYQLAKYKLIGHEYNIYDLIRITHAHSAAIDKIYETGSFEDIDTWERKISMASSDEERDNEWIRLVEDHSLGLLALLRNLRNILSALSSYEENLSSWIMDNLYPQLTNEQAIRKSLVFPYQIYAAYAAIRDEIPPALLDALCRAFEISIQNMPEMEGKSAFFLDVSGSMNDTISPKSNITLKEVGAVYAAAMMIKNPNNIFIKFGTYAKQCNYQRSIITLNPFSIIDKMINTENCGCGTSVSSAFTELNESVSRIFLISDQQTMGDNWYTTPAIDNYNKYCSIYGDAHIYSFDLGNYHGQYANPHNPYVHLITGLNDKIFKILPYLEKNRDVLVNLINLSFSC